MKINKVIKISLIGILFLTCQNKINVEEEKTKLLETDREFSETSVRLGAAEAFRRFLDEDAMQLPAGQKPIRGVENIYQAMNSSGNGYTLSWEPQEGNVAASGELGYTWSIYKIIGINPDDSRITRHGKYLNVWKKQLDESWKVLIDMGNPNPDE